MQLESVTGKLLRKALGVYCKYAWPGHASRRCRELVAWNDDDCGEALLAYLENGSSKTQEPDCRRYTIRAGNERYPFMKVGVEEWMREGEFFLYVDTHDEMQLPRDDADYGAWRELCRHNAELKRKIEYAWHKAGLPTLKDTEEMYPVRDGQKSAIIGENSGYEAKALAALLGEEGYRAVLTSDTEFLLKEVWRCRPDIVVVNSFVGEVPGHIVAETLHRDPELSSIPILLIISPLDRMDHSHDASGVLPKPVTINGLRRALVSCGVA